MEEQMEKEQRQVVDVQFRPGQKVYFFDPNGLTLAAGDHVIIDTARGAEFGTCASGIHKVDAATLVAPLRPVLRKATARDERILQDNQAREKKAYAFCQEKIAYLGLDMQLVSAECAFDGSKILFYFTADERVDFRELVKDLAGVFHTRIELRQIGVRDEAKMLGGLGICGRPFCCASFLDDFQPVSIKMAKTQSLSLNPTKISGTCGRLMCCLKYEQDTYESLIRTSPKPESFVDTPEGRGTVVEADILRQRVKVQMEGNPDTVSVFSNEEIVILRNGKAKKNDPPIPADLAPISGGGKRVRKQPEEAPLLEPIRFRYRSESLVEEQPAPEQPVQEEPPERRERSGRGRQRRPRGESPEAAEQPQAEERRPRRERSRRPRPENQEQRPDAQRQGSRRRRDRGGKQGAQQDQQSAQQSAAQPAAQQSAPEAAAGQEPRKPRRSNYRRRKLKNPQGGSQEGQG